MFIARNVPRLHRLRGPEDLRARIAELEAEVRVLHTMLQSAPDIITRISVDGEFLYLSR